MRGGRVYDPPNGWKRFAVRVAGRFDDGDNTWMSMDGSDGEWAVAYHGTSGRGLAPIVTQGLKAGERQLHSSDVGSGIYCSPELSTAQSYCQCVQSQGRSVNFIIQCRVRPEAIKVCPKQTAYWVINKSKDMRPYGILVTGG
mmetsp:Transcript_106993/g.168946  ORF Transcript_106993/g.168946 Transcript_106993/m.168946 type:complete len:142 (+) Transcript_106993:3-428(+)